ncbi:MAG: cell division protein ZapA [Prevotellaceae bacterium]|jgi:cell division protein ZapA|nr:cell division protein ZapA [Prevotellaceae bacterium]
MDDKLSIKISIADRYYPLKIAVGDEERIRNAAKRINEKIDQYRQRYPERDIQDALSMASLQFMIRLLESENNEYIGPLVQELDSINAQLEEYIQKEL